MVSAGGSKGGMPYTSEGREMMNSVSVDVSARGCLMGSCTQSQRGTGLKIEIWGFQSRESLGNEQAQNSNRHCCLRVTESPQRKLRRKQRLRTNTNDMEVKGRFQGGGNSDIREVLVFVMC